MRYVSTRGAAPVLDFGEAMLTGLARDGGLYVPETIPTLSKDDIAALSGLTYEEAAFRIMRPFVGDTFTDAEFRSAINKAYRGFGHAARHSGSPGRASPARRSRRSSAACVSLSSVRCLQFRPDVPLHLPGHPALGSIEGIPF